MNDINKIIAKIELFSGGNVRKTPFTNGYRPAFDFLGEKTKISGCINLISVDKFMPGMTGIVQIAFIKGMIDNRHFKAGEKFTFGEGLNIMGKGEIIEMIS